MEYRKNRLLIEIADYDNNGKIIVLKVESDDFLGKGAFCFNEDGMKQYIR